MKRGLSLNLSAPSAASLPNSEMQDPGNKHTNFTHTEETRNKTRRATLKAIVWVSQHTASEKIELPDEYKIHDNSKRGEGYVLRVTVHEDGASIYKTFYLGSTVEGIDLQSKLKEIVMREVNFQLKAYETVAKDLNFKIKDEHGFDHKIKIPELQSVWFHDAEPVAQLKMEQIKFHATRRPTRNMYNELEDHYSDSFYHNDFNDGNFKYDQKGNVVLLDFGSGDHIRSDRKGGRTRWRTRRRTRRGRRNNSSFR